jgi:hypothetical protein
VPPSPAGLAAMKFLVVLVDSGPVDPPSLSKSAVYLINQGIPKIKGCRYRKKYLIELKIFIS